MPKSIWKSIAQLILNNKVACLLGLAIFTLAMGFYASKVQISYELPKILPKSDPNYQLYESFKKRFGEDGNVLVVGVETEKMYELAFLQKWIALSKKIRHISLLYMKNRCNRHNRKPIQYSLKAYM